ncbi:MAG TPA: ABC transporter permease subunit [Alphaproteobacteria bacterium]|nr:ABC transporter permease subunit [Alphaproteobacteria bacterium]
MRMRVRVLLMQALVLGLLIALAQVAVTEGWVNRFLLPSPGDIWDAGVALATGEHPLQAFLSTIGATLSAILLAVAVGVPAGWALWRYPVLGRAYEGWLGAIFASPKLLLYPLFLVVMGRGFGTLLAMAWITAVIPIVLKTREGLASVPAVLVRVGRSFKLSERQLLWKVMFPAAVPAIFTGIRLSMIYTLIVVVALEFLLSLGGLGGMVGDMYDRYDIPATYAAIVFVLVLSAVYFRILERIQTWLRSD